MLTDFPVEGSRMRVLGTRLYYDSVLSCSEAASTLRFSGSVQERNSYLTESGGVVLDSLGRPTADEWLSALKNLGEWCYLDPR